ncbi:MAG: cation transporter [Steroidobacteraceae bacterium]
MSGHESSARAILYAFLANLGIALTKLWAAGFTGSGSMLAEAIHSFADCGNQVLLWIGLRQSQRPADALHPLGYGKVTYFWSFVVAILLFSLGGLFSIYEGWHKLHAPEPLSRPWIALVVLAVSIALESGSLLGCLREIARLRRGRPLLEWLRTTRNAELGVVLGEDYAALLGLAIAFTFVALRRRDRRRCATMRSARSRSASCWSASRRSSRCASRACSSGARPRTTCSPRSAPRSRAIRRFRRSTTSSRCSSVRR